MPSATAMCRRPFDWLLIPRVLHGVSDASVSGQSRAGDIDPVAGTVEGQQGERGGRRQVDRRRPARVDHVHRGRRRAGDARSRIAPVPDWRGRRACPTHDRTARRRRRARAGVSASVIEARRIASSVSVASLSTGCSSISSSWAYAHILPWAEMLSRSPTSTAGRSPAATAWSRPLSAAMIIASASASVTARCESGPPPTTTTTCDIASLRWHYPDQVPVGGGAHPLSPPILRAPRFRSPAV